MLKKFAMTTFAALILAAGAVAATAQAPVSQALASGAVTVYAPSPQLWRVKVDPKTMGNVTLSGHFSVTAGTPKTVDVFVFNEENYLKWRNDDEASKTAKPLASVLHLGEGDINAKLSDAGYYFLVISDRKEYEGKKTVSTDFKFQYDKH